MLILKKNTACTRSCRAFFFLKEIVKDDGHASVELNKKFKSCNKVHIV